MLGPGNAFTNTEHPVGEVLQEKNSPLQEIAVVDPIKPAFEFYEEVLDPASLEMSSSNLEVFLWHLGGASRPG